MFKRNLGIYHNSHPFGIKVKHISEILFYWVREKLNVHLHSLCDLFLFIYFLYAEDI